MKRLNTSFSALVCILGIMVFFQNCAQTGFQNSETFAVAKADAAGDGGKEQMFNEDVNKDDEESELDDKDEDGRRLDCAKLLDKQASLVALKADVSVVNMHGHLRAKAEGNIAKIEQFSGSLRLLGLKEGSSVGSHSYANGNALFCGISVKSISHAVGNIIVIGGDVGDIDDFRGNLLVLGGKITGKVTNVKGNVRAKQ